MLTVQCNVCYNKSAVVWLAANEKGGGPMPHLRSPIRTRASAARLSPTTLRRISIVHGTVRAKVVISHHLRHFARPNLLQTLRLKNRSPASKTPLLALSAQIFSTKQSQRTPEPCLSTLI